MKDPLSRSLATLVVLLGSIAIAACGGSGDCSGPLCGGGPTGPASNPPGAPGNVSLTVSGTTITVTWSAGSGATSHRVNLATTGEETRSQTVGGTATSASFDRLTPARTYTGQVVAINSVGETAGAAAQALVPATTGEIRVRLSIDEAPLNDYPIDLLDVATGSTSVERTDASGIANFTDVEPGAYQVYVAPGLDFYSFATAGRTVEVQAGATSAVNLNGTAAITELVAGTPVTGLSGSPRSVRWFVLAVTPAQVVAASTSVRLTLSGGTGDADLLVLDPSNKESGSNGASNDELVVVDIVAGEWHVLVFGSSGFAGVTLRAVLR